MGNSFNGTLVYVGAGDGSTLDDYLEAGAEKLLLLESDPVQFAKLEASVKDIEGVDVLPYALAAHAGSAELQVTNIPGLASLTAPTEALREIYLGLKVARRVEVETKTPRDLSDHLK